MDTYTSSPAATNPPASGRGWRRLVAALLTLSVIITAGYSVVSLSIATQIQVVKQTPPYATPASLGVQYPEVTFPSRDDHLQLQGWFLPGVLPTGQLTSQRAIIIKP